MPEANERGIEEEKRRKKYGKATKIGVKMTCSTCKQHHNKKGCKTRNQSGVSRDMGQSSTSSAQHNGTKASATTPIVPMASNPSSICEDTSRVQKSQSKSGAFGGRGKGRGRGRGRGRGGGIPTSDSGLGVEGGRGRSGVGANSSAQLVPRLHHDMIALQDQGCGDMDIHYFEMLILI
ncbi:uncharacterized protein LOC132054060 [Lycium ferocissimum]|uniref:uncharacterized protein LOC132054060 n=1 Tax=Lycium ferocissimum TaxID=112874 RepID=UPI0028164E97|nr:uncharacterized protein LOC132054060 [Lycium ferocissimum]